MKQYRVLTQDEVEHFLTRGYVLVRECFSREAADRLTSTIWERLGYDRDDPSTWKQGRIHMPNNNRWPMHEFAPKAWAAACDLLGGESRVKKPCLMADGFIVNFGLGADKPWEPPAATSTGWHKDGDFFRHFLDSPEQGLLTLVYWSDVEPRGGGTFMACDSVAPVARYLLEHPKGTTVRQFKFGSLITECTEFIETTARLGDIYLIHPFILHAASQNHSGKPRILTNPPIQLKQPMDFNRPDPDDFSPVELAVLRALGVDRLDYQIIGKRGRVKTERERRWKTMRQQEAARLAKAAS